MYARETTEMATDRYLDGRAPFSRIPMMGPLIQVAWAALMIWVCAGNFAAAFSQRSQGRTAESIISMFFSAVAAFVAALTLSAV